MPQKQTITKAIFPIGGLGTRFLPATKSMPKEMLTIVDKPLIQYAVEEAAEAGITDFIFITGRYQSIIENHFDKSSEHGNITYIRQQNPDGLGHAVWCARTIAHTEPVAVILPDDLIIPPKGQTGCLAQMIDAWHDVGGNMLACMEVEPHQTSSYGIITPQSTKGNITQVKDLVEKPDPQDAPSQLAIVGRYIIQPPVFDELGRMKKGAGNEIQLTDSLARRIGHEPLSAFTINGTRYDCGSKIGFLKANIATALERDDLSHDLTSWLKTLG